MKLLLVALVVVYLAAVQCISKKQQKKCQESLEFIESSCASKGYKPPPEITCHFTTTKKGRKANYNKKKCRKAAKICVEKCPHYHCGRTTMPPTVTTVPCPGSNGYVTSTEVPGGGGQPCVPSVPTTPEGGW
ncbi:hypothetical protein ACHWQZ_G018981 [Mnemiopsis leidyi]